MVEQLLNGGADPTAAGPDGATALHLALTSFDSQIYQLLLDRAPSLEIRDARGFTPLHRAVYSSNEGLRMLLAKKADFEAITFAGETPLHLAVRNTFCLGVKPSFKQVLTNV